MGILISLVATVIIVGIFSALGLQLLGEIRDDMTASSAEYNATKEAIAGVAKVPAKLGLFVTIGVITIFITMLLGIFAYTKMKA